MSLEYVTAVSSVGTLIVIAATAIAAILQLRHMRSANKVSAIQTFLTTFEGPELRDAFHFVRADLAKRLEDPEFRRELRTGELDRTKHPEIQVANFFDQWGLYYRDGVIDKISFMRVNAGIVIRFWDRLEPAIALSADPKFGNTAFQQFELLVIEARRWLAKHPEGDWPKSERRLTLIDQWREIDSIGSVKG